MSDENKMLNRMKDIYILSKQVNKKILNIIIIKQKKGENKNKRLFFKENEKENNKDYNKKNITILEYNIENVKNIKTFGKLFVIENRKKCRIILNNKEKELKKYVKINNKKKDLKIKLEIYEYLINIKEMFKECQAIRKINKLNTLYVTNMSRIFFDVFHYLLYLIFQNGIQIMLLIWKVYFMDAHH